MAPHSSTLAWQIPWTEEPGRLQSMGSLRVGHDWVTSLSLFTFLHWRRKWQPTPVFLPGESQGWGSLVAAIYGVTQSWTRLKRLSSSSIPCRGGAQEIEPMVWRQEGGLRGVKGWSTPRSSAQVKDGPWTGWTVPPALSPSVEQPSAGRGQPGGCGWLGPRGPSEALTLPRAEMTSGFCVPAL